MPVVHGKHYSYSPKGVKAAKAAAKHHSGKGTKARLNTAAEKMMFGRKASQ